MSPRFASEEYWDDFFAKKIEPYEWLLSPKEIRETVAQVLERYPSSPRVLHIGCGSSSLSQQLRDLVDTPNQIHNVDYSETVIKQAAESDTGGMLWSRADLLSLIDVQRLSRDGPYDLIVDKGATDSVALGDDVNVTPYSTVGIHPVYLLLIRLAGLTRPDTGRWVVVSFSEDRFPTMPVSPKLDVDGTPIETVKDLDSLSSSLLWVLEKKWSVPAPSEVELTETSAYRPQMFRWIYILRRTSAVPQLHT